MKKIYFTFVVGFILMPTILISQTFSISGQITRHNSDPLPDIEIGCIETVLTDVDGNFEIPDIPLNTMCDITGIGVFDKFEDVTVLDVLIMQQYLLQTNSNINGYQILACDVNYSQSITTLDLVKGMKLALRIDDAGIQDNWLCIDADYVFGTPLVSGSTSISVNITDTLTDVDFVGVKRGDPAISSDYMPAPVGAPTPTFFISNESFQTGDEVEFEVTVEDFSNIIGFQQTFKWDPNVLSFESIDGFSGTSVELNNDLINQGLLPTVSVRNDSPIQDGEVLIKLNFTALSDVSNPLEVVSFSDDIIQKQVVWKNPIGIDLFILDGEYKYGEATTKIINAPSGLESFQILPNPVEENFHVKVLLIDKEDFEISILNVLGQNVFSKTFDQKELFLEVGFSEFPAGNYFLRLKTADGIHTESFIKK